MERRPHTLSSFLALFPWTDAERALGQPLEFLWTFDLDTAPARIWPELIDTSRFNRALGTGPMTFREVDGRLYGTTKNLIFRQDWLEIPWTWIAERQLVGARVYSKGFAHMVRSVYLLDPLDDGARTRVTVYFGFVPKNALSRAFLRVGFGTFQAGFRRVLDELVTTQRAQAPQGGPYQVPAEPRTTAQQAHLAALRGKVEATLRARGIDVAALDALVAHVATADELDLQRIQVIPLARAWKVDEDCVLKTCLHATRAGLLSLSWDVICPHCRGVREEARSLGDVPGKSACDVCRIDFDTAAENSIEITFRVHPQVRVIDATPFCAAEPAKKAHIVLQQRVAPRAQVVVQTALPPGRFRLRVAGQRRHRLLDVVDGAPGNVAWTAGDGDGGSAAEPLRDELLRDEPPAEDALRAAPAPHFALMNAGGDEHTFIIERAGWADFALRPGRLFTLQEFRDLFSEEYLTTGVQVSVGEQTILFTDMIGSTRFYDVRGDAEAFAEVKRHFTEIYEIVRRHRGAVVKTIGDAVMAAFPDPKSALRAAVDIHAAFSTERAGSSVRLRISLNTGPCIAVNLNSAIDYFGRTVNIASKLQACADAGQIAFPRRLCDAPDVRALIAQLGGRLDEVTAVSSTLTAPIPTYRWDVNELAAPRPTAT